MVQMGCCNSDALELSYFHSATVRLVLPDRSVKNKATEAKAKGHERPKKLVVRLETLLTLFPLFCAVWLCSA